VIEAISGSVSPPFPKIPQEGSEALGCLLFSISAYHGLHPGFLHDTYKGPIRNVQRQLREIVKS